MSKRSRTGRARTGARLERERRHAGAWQPTLDRRSVACGEAPSAFARRKTRGRSGASPPLAAFSTNVLASRVVHFLYSADFSTVKTFTLGDGAAWNAANSVERRELSESACPIMAISASFRLFESRRSASSEALPPAI